MTATRNYNTKLTRARWTETNFPRLHHSLLANKLPLLNAQHYSSAKYTMTDKDMVQKNKLKGEYSRRHKQVNHATVCTSTCKICSKLSIHAGFFMEQTRCKSDCSFCDSRYDYGGHFSYYEHSNNILIHDLALINIATEYSLQSIIDIDFYWKNVQVNLINYCSCCIFTDKVNKKHHNSCCCLKCTLSGNSVLYHNLCN